LNNAARRDRRAVGAFRASKFRTFAVCRRYLHRREVYRKQNDQLDAIAERSDMLPIIPPPISESQGSTGNHIVPKETVPGDDNRVAKNVTKEQINSLAKMLSALRR
jgi:hypothetical protein